MQKEVRTIEDIREACQILTKKYQQEVAFRIFGDGSGRFYIAGEKILNTVLSFMSDDKIIINIPDPEPFVSVDKG